MLLACNLPPRKSISLPRPKLARGGRHGPARPLSLPPANDHSLGHGGTRGDGRTDRQKRLLFWIGRERDSRIADRRWQSLFLDVLISHRQPLRGLQTWRTRTRATTHGKCSPEPSPDSSRACLSLQSVTLPDTEVLAGDPS